MTKKPVVSAPKPLTTSQMKYALERLHAIADQLVNARIKKMPERPPKPELSNAEKLALIRAGKAKFDKRTTNYYTNVVDAFVYPEHERKLAAWQKLEKARAAKRTAIRDEVEAKRKALADELALGADGSVALAKLEAFAKLK